MILVFRRDSAALEDKHVEILGELLTRERVERLRIVGHWGAGEAEHLGAERSQTVRDGLVSRAVPTAMLETGAGAAAPGQDGFVSFLALECAR